jgi:hypothetical protein
MKQSTQHSSTVREVLTHDKGAFHYKQPAEINGILNTPSFSTDYSTMLSVSRLYRVEWWE